MRSLRVKRLLLEMLKLAVIAAICFWPVHYYFHRDEYTAIAQTRGFLSYLCGAEAKWMAERSRDCLDMARRGVPWDDVSEEAEALRICPFETDHPRRPSWIAQSEVWDRAAQRALRASTRHAAVSDAHLGCSPWAGP